MRQNTTSADLRNGFQEKKNVVQRIHNNHWQAVSLCLKFDSVDGKSRNVLVFVIHRVARVS